MIFESKSKPQWAVLLACILFGAGAITGLLEFMATGLRLGRSGMVGAEVLRLVLALLIPLMSMWCGLRIARNPRTARKWIWINTAWILLIAGAYLGYMTWTLGVAISNSGLPFLFEFVKSLLEPLAPLAAVLYFLYSGRRRGYFDELPGHCKACGYDLTGNVSGTCPECGTACEEAAAIASQ